MPITAIVLAGGDPAPASLAASLPPDALVIAADAGLEQAPALGLTVHLAVGDFDSVDPAALDAAVAAGAAVERHRPDKDQTDLELALLAARDRGARHVVVVGGGGGRLDHLLANALVLASPAFAGMRIEAHLGAALVVPVHRAACLHGRVGDTVTLLAVGGPARGVRTSGLLYALHGQDLQPGSTRGVSNELVATTAHVAVASGSLLAVQPAGGR
ncbi:MAG: thiamine diphosphokinase [Acidimicrobiales bacterium]|nr:thiamine diphosphokinase [Acidimicrobiales bacterium]